MSTLPHPPAECVATLLRWLVHAVVTRGLCGRLAGPVMGPILDRIRGINQRFKRLAARLAAGTYTPRRSFHRRKAIDPKPRRQSPLPQNFGWLVPLVPEAVVFRAQLESLLQHPEMAALMAEAPAPMARILRPLCWMLRVTPPPILARPRRQPAPAPAAAPPPRPNPPRSRPRPPVPPKPPPLPPLPEWLQDRRKPWSMARMRGPRSA